MNARHHALLVAAIAATAASCAVESPDEITDDDSLEVIDEGKLDNYYSTTGIEYDVSGTDALAVEPGLGAAAAKTRAQSLVAYRFKALSWFIYQYVTNKEQKESNASYGGFNALVRQDSFDATGLTEAGGGRFTYRFKAQIAGPTKLLSGTWIKKEGTRRFFELKLPKLTNGELESGAYAKTYKTFDPATANFELETLKLEIAPAPPSIDAYPDYAALFADKKLDVAIHVGGDYNESRHDLRAARDLFAQLKAAGFTAPVATFEELKLGSGAFKKKLVTPKGDVSVEVTLFHPDMNGSDYEALVEAYKQSARTRDVVIYDGHAGYDASYSGVVVKYNPRVALAAQDFATLDLPSKYQLFVFNGCKTYGMYPDQMYRNPRKTPANLDIISTVSFSWLSEMTRITTAVVTGLAKNATAGHFPLAYGQLLAEMNRGQSHDVLYGVHGLDDNPHVSPWADPAKTGIKCTAAAQCGSADTSCVKPAGAGCKVCAPACTDDSGCATGYKCKTIASTSSNTLAGKRCVPTRPQCR